MISFRRLHPLLRIWANQSRRHRASSIAILTTLLFVFEYWLILYKPLQIQHAHTALTPAQTTTTEPSSTPLPLGCDMGAVKQIASRYHLAPLLGQPAEVQAHGTLSVDAAHLIVTGSFDQLQDFVTALNQHTSTLTVDNLQLERTNQQRLDLHARILCLRLSRQEEIL